MNIYFLITFFGLIGIFSRYGLDQAFANLNETFPVSTFTINILGSFLAGLIYVLSERLNWSPSLNTALFAGFCGGFTTFSAYTLQTMSLMEKGRLMPALIYFVLSPLLGFIAAAIPILASKKFGA